MPIASSKFTGYPLLLCDLVTEEVLQTKSWSRSFARQLIEFRETLTLNSLLYNEGYQRTARWRETLGEVWKDSECRSFCLCGVGMCHLFQQEDTFTSQEALWTQYFRGFYEAFIMEPWSIIISISSLLPSVENGQCGCSEYVGYLPGLLQIPISQ